VGFEIYIECFGESQRSGISRTAVRELFPIAEKESQPDDWRIQYDSKNICDISATPLTSDAARLTSLCIFHPCADLKLWVGLYSLLQLGSVVIYWPGSPPIVAEGFISANLPKEMIDAMGAPRVVRSAADILQILSES
jgi:hypothetical protein